jgi:hypothetical protein
MQEDRPKLVARISAETFASADLNQIFQWLIECQYNPVRLDADHLLALGQPIWLKVARPITAPRAVLCALWLLEEVHDGVCLLAGTLRFVAHPTASDVRLSFDGRTVPTGHGDNAARQLLEQIVASIDRMASRTIPLSAAG